MSDAVIDDFLKAPLEERARLALDENTAPFIRTFLGPPAYEEYAEIARRVRRAAEQEHLAAADKNLIFIPGVMGSQLKSEELGGVWWIDSRTRKHLDHLRLNPEGTASADPKHQVSPFTTDPSYDPFLSAVWERDDFGHVLFPYDWRMSLTRSAARLRDEVLQTFEGNGGRKIHLVAHSMGGLLVRETLAAHPELWPKLGRIVFLGTPHYGSPAIAGYLKNHLWGWELMAVLGLFLSRPTFRSLWGVLELLPAPRGVYPGTREDDRNPWPPSAPDDPYVHPCANFDLYNAEDWKLEMSAEEKAALQRVLDGAAAFHRRLYDAHRALDQELRDRMAVIAGAGIKTLFRLQYEKELFGLWERARKITSRIPDDPHRDGDGRVPVASAKLEDVGQVRYVRGEHGGLPAIPAVYKDVFRWLNEEPMQLPSTPNGALGDHLAGGELAPKAPHLAGAPLQGPDGEDPGYWRDEPFTEEQIAALEARLAAGEMPGFNRLHIL
jgi:pimeloyl-ACP methyl ester carboxylesterase